MGKRCICIALVLILVTTIGMAPLAQPAEAVAGVVVAGAVVAVMAMAGITIVTSGMTAAQIQDWVEDKLEEWAADVGSPLDHLINSAGIGVTISGLLTIGTAAAQGINQFITWLKNELGLNDNDSQVITSTVPSLGTFQGVMTQYVLAPVSGRWVNWTFNKPVLVGVCYYSPGSSNFEGVAAILDEPFTVNGNPATQYGRFYAVNTAAEYPWNFKPTQPEISTVNDDPWCLDRLSYTLQNLSNDTQLNEGNTLSIDTGVIAIPQVQNDDKVFVDVGALPGSTVSEVTEGVLTDVAADTLDVSGTVAEEEPEYVITGPVSVSGLDDIFPFCIPFDLYHMLEALAADPVAPYFEWRFYVPRIVDYTLVIDLSGFNTVAQILRVMETLLFCVGLAFETRKLIRS